MPEDRDFKRLVRRRMAVTGERYTAARAALRPAPVAAGSDVLRWVGELGHPKSATAAFQALRDLPDAMLRPAAIAGMADPNWRIRRSCCRLLDDLTLSPESTAALERRLDDPHPLVRRAALHTLSCQHCKPDGCALDVRPLLERMASDPSRLVRRGIVLGLGWAHDHDLEPWVSELVRRFAESDPSAQLREAARGILAQQELKRRSNRDRLQLPPELRARTERHRGQWVAVAAGLIVGVGDPRAFRHARRTWPDTALYWVSAAGG